MPRTFLRALIADVRVFNFSKPVVPSLFPQSAKEFHSKQSMQVPETQWAKYPGFPKFKSNQNSDNEVFESTRLQERDARGSSAQAGLANNNKNQTKKERLKEKLKNHSRNRKNSGSHKEKLEKIPKFFRKSFSKNKDGLAFTVLAMTEKCQNGKETEVLREKLFKAQQQLEQLRANQTKIESGNTILLKRLESVLAEKEKVESERDTLIKSQSVIASMRNDFQAQLSACEERCQNQLTLVMSEKLLALREAEEARKTTEARLTKVTGELDALKAKVSQSQSSMSVPETTLSEGVQFVFHGKDGGGHFSSCYIVKKDKKASKPSS